MKPIDRSYRDRARRLRMEALERRRRWSLVAFSIALGIVIGWVVSWFLG